MKKRVKAAEKLAEDRDQKVNKEYFFPKKLFKDVEKEYKDKDLNTDPDKVLSEIEQILKDQKSSVPQVNKVKQTAEIQTPPLGDTPMPVVQTAQLNVNPNTNLTRTQEALLSPSEKIIASRT